MPDDSIVTSLNKVAFIPVRGGSKSIPLKNIKPIGGKPLVYWVCKAASECAAISAVYVATDSDEISAAVRAFGLPGVYVVGRGVETANDTASTEFALLEFAAAHRFDDIALVQATSPLLTALDLSRGFEALSRENIDSVLSVVRQKRFIWSETIGGGGGGFITPANYSVNARPRRQDFDGFLVENGAFYITSRERLLESGCRLSGNIGYVEMAEDSYFEIDEPTDWIVAEALLNTRVSEAFNLRRRDIRLFLTDCDGTLTDGGMYYSLDGDALKKFNTKDGHGFSMLRDRGVITGIITGEDSPIVEQRAKKLSLDFVRRGTENKAAVIEQLCAKYGYCWDNVAYIGDDINDLESIRKAAFGVCVADGCAAAKSAANYVTKADGGRGAVREAAEIVLGWLDER